MLVCRLPSRDQCKALGDHAIQPLIGIYDAVGALRKRAMKLRLDSVCGGAREIMSIGPGLHPRDTRFIGRAEEQEPCFGRQADPGEYLENAYMANAVDDEG